MRKYTNLVLACVAVALLIGPVSRSQTPAASPSNSSKITPDGTAYITRVVPVPTSISPEAQKMLSQPASDVAGRPRSIQEDRAAIDRWQSHAGEVSLTIYPAKLSMATIANVPVRIADPIAPAAALRDRVLINLHGGGFHVDSGSLTETIPIANLTGIRVVSVLYRLAPEHPFPAAVDDAVAVYKELLHTYAPERIAIYGTSAGATLTAEVTAKIQQLKLPMPGATGIFSGIGDLGQPGDSVNLFGLNGLSGHLDPPGKNAEGLEDYVGGTSLKDQVLSPVYSNLAGFPPTLFLTSGRDRRLSSTTLLQRAYMRAGVDTRLVVFDALPHAFWNDANLPESKEAYAIMATFFLTHTTK